MLCTWQEVVAGSRAELADILCLRVKWKEESIAEPSSEDQKTCLTGPRKQDTRSLIP